jgi:hypothetical protein
MHDDTDLARVADDWHNQAARDLDAWGQTEAGAPYDVAKLHAASAAALLAIDTRLAMLLAGRS